MGPISKPFYYGGHAAGVGGEVGCVDLPDVAQADNLGVTPGAGDQRFKLFRGEVLRLVDDQKGVV